MPKPDDLGNPQSVPARVVLRLLYLLVGNLEDDSWPDKDAFFILTHLRLFKDGAERVHSVFRKIRDPSDRVELPFLRVPDSHEKGRVVAGPPALTVESLDNRAVNGVPLRLNLEPSMGSPPELVKRTKILKDDAFQASPQRVVIEPHKRNLVFTVDPPSQIL